MTNLHTKLDAFHDAIQALSPTSPASDFEKFASFLDPNGTFYLGGMNEPPIVGRELAIEGMKKLLTYWKLCERNVVARTVSADGTVAMAEMDNLLEIRGTPLIFKEAEVAQFNDEGLICVFKLYCDSRPIEEIMARKGD